MDTHLVITALAPDRPGIVEQLALAVQDSGCNVADSRMTVMGGEFAVLLMVSGKWNQLAKLEAALPALERDLGLGLISRRTEPNASDTELLPYTVDVVSLDHSGIVYQLAHFFASRRINIQELNTVRYTAIHTATPMFSVSMAINVPASIHIATLRDEFLDFCDHLNLDAVLEPVKR